MAKANKILKWVALGLLIVTLCLAIAGTVLMFLITAEGPTSYGYDYTVHLWKAGILPLVGTIFFLIAMPFYFVSSKNRYLLIGTVVSLFIAMFLLNFVRVSTPYSYVVTSYVILRAGLRLCAAARLTGALLMGCSIAMLVLHGVERKKEAKKMEAANPKKKGTFATNYLAFATEVKEAKALLDGGVFSQYEYQNEKARIFAKYGFALEAEAEVNTENLSAISAIEATAVASEETAAQEVAASDESKE